MSKDGNHAGARDPQELEQLLVARQQAGDIEGLIALYESDAVISGDGREVRGHHEIRLLFTAITAAGHRFTLGRQQPAVISGDLAFTSTRGADGNVTAEVARRQQDGTWLWVVDRFSIAKE
jgi:ketosteroid isomerase-like protein